MCGIHGLVQLDGKHVDAELLSRMGRVTAHRGPDDEGLHVDGDAGGAVDVHAFVVGATVGGDVTHGRQQPRFDRPPVEVDETVDAAHALQTPRAGTARPRPARALR